MTNKPSEMTDQEIDTALAEKMGWHKGLESDAWRGLCVSSNLGVSQETVWLNSKNAGMWKCDYWHPHDDLNQVWQCEEKLLETITERIYEDCLNFILTMEFGYGKYSAIHAPARQRCIAMLMAIRDEHG
jgi:hypothetical protein